MDLSYMITTVTKCAQLWEDTAVCLSGGALELSKCYYQLIHWYWDSMGFPQMPSLQPMDSLDTGFYETTPGTYSALELSLGREATKTRIKQRAANLSNKSLGISTSPSGQWKDEDERLKIKSNTHAVLTMSHQLQRQDAHQAHRIIWAPQMTYSLPITGMTGKQLEGIQKMPAEQA